MTAALADSFVSQALWGVGGIALGCVLIIGFAMLRLWADRRAFRQRMTALQTRSVCNTVYPTAVDSDYAARFFDSGGRP